MQAPAGDAVGMAAAADGDVNCSLPGIDIGMVVLARHRRWGEEVAAWHDAAHRMRALEVMLVTGKDKVDTVEVRRGHGDLVHEHHDPVDVVVLTRTSQLALEPPALQPAAVAADVRIESRRTIAGDVVPAQPAETAVLHADIVIVERDESHRPCGKRVPVARESRRSVARQFEPGLVRQVALSSVPRLILVIPWSRHPRAVPGRPAYVREVRRPCVDRLIAGVRVREVSVDEVEERVELIDSGHHVTGVGRVRPGSVTYRRGYGVIAKAGEPEGRRATFRRGPERTRHRVSTVVQHLVAVYRIGLEGAQPRVVGPDGLAGQGVGVGALFGLDLAAGSRFCRAEPEPGPRHRRGYRPGHCDLTRRIRAELKMNLLRGGNPDCVRPADESGQHAASPR